MKKILTATEAAQELRISGTTLRRWRMRGIGPRYFKLQATGQGAIRYRETDIEDWLAERTRRSTADHGVGASGG